MNPKLIEIAIKGGLGVVLAGLLGAVLYWSHVERLATHREATERLMPILESIASDLRLISKTYSPDN